MHSKKQKTLPVSMKLSIPAGMTYSSLGKGIKVSPKANVSVFTPGYAIEFNEPSVEVTIGIGKDHTAHLVMTKNAWEALKSGEIVDIETVQKFKEKIK